jgi:predicted DNA-binding helix-hairpin-helix protein
MEPIDKLSLSAQAALWEAEGAPPSAPPPRCTGRRGQGETWVDVGGINLPVTYASGGGGRTVRLLKAMLTTACERDCLYCSFRAGHDCQRVTFKPEEMAGLHIQIHRAGLVDGLFLSTGILKGGANTQNKLIDTAEILRRQGYQGYLHLKIMPGAERGQVWRAMQLADRVSVNLEAPNPARLERLAPHKAFVDELLTPLRWVAELRREMPPRAAWRGRMPSSATQLVVGPARETDLEILTTSEKVLRGYGLSRVYYSAFSPVEGTPLENHPPESPLREHRLYQASFLLRDYGFDLEDLPFSGDGQLPRDRDPKLAYAEGNLRDRPVELDRAGREELLRVPGIGPRSAEAILRVRRGSGRLRGFEDLGRLGIVAERAAPYITIGGKGAPRQMALL